MAEVPTVAEGRSTPVTMGEVSTSNVGRGGQRWAIIPAALLTVTTSALLTVAAVVPGGSPIRQLVSWILIGVAVYFFGCRSKLGVPALIGIPAGVILSIIVLFVRRELPVLVAIAAVETAITGAAAALGAAASRRSRSYSGVCRTNG